MFSCKNQCKQLHQILYEDWDGLEASRECKHLFEKQTTLWGSPCPIRALAPTVLGGVPPNLIGVHLGPGWPLQKMAPLHIRALAHPMDPLIQILKKICGVGGGGGEEGREKSCHWCFYFLF